MLKNQKNQLLKVLLENGFTINDVEFNNETGPDVVYINDTPFEFQFYVEENGFDKYSIAYTAFSPTYNLIEPHGDYYLNFEDIISIFEAWLITHVKNYFKELDEIDLWETMKMSNEFIDPNFIDFNDQGYFDQSDKDQIVQIISDFKILIPERFNITTGELEIINQKLDYLTAKLDTMNKFDWKSLFVQTMLGIALNMMVDKEVGIQLFELFKSMFSRIPRLIG